MIKSKLGNTVTVQGGVAEAQVEQTFQGYATRGYGLLLVDGAEMQQQAVEIAKQYPHMRVVVVNGDASAAPNLSSATYSWEQSGFLAGIAAGIATKSDKLGSVGSIKIPPIEGLYYGYEQGVKAVNPKATTEMTYMNTNVPDTGLSDSLTAAEISRGDDIIYTQATGADPGVFRAGCQHHVLVIGYGTNEENLGPSCTLTTQLVNYQGTMVTMATMYDQGVLKPQIYTYGFKDHAFSLAPIINVSKAIAAKIQTVAAEAEAGKFTIKTLSSTY
ncbi:MAG: BMP family ABC transporter substrate-binding protein [Trebonia sp.]